MKTATTNIPIYPRESFLFSCDKSPLLKHIATVALKPFVPAKVKK